MSDAIRPVGPAGTHPVGPAGVRPGNRTIWLDEPVPCTCTECFTEHPEPCRCVTSHPSKVCACCRAGYHDGRCAEEK